MGNLFQELKRRKVFRVAAVYVIVAWLIIQVAGEILPTFDAPQWVSQTIILVLTLGFPLALVLAWAFEMTPEGIRADAVAQPPPQPSTQFTERKLIYAIFALVLLVAVFQVTDRFLFTEQQTVTAHSPQNSPVMRFIVAVGEDADLYLGGVADVFFGRPAATTMALSNNGDLLIYSAREQGPDGTVNSQLYLRRLDQVRAFPIEGTQGGSSPFFSPDDTAIGFFVGSTLRRVQVTGGIAETIIADSERQYFGFGGASWGDDGTIIYSDSIPGTIFTYGLYRVAASGGRGELLVDPESSLNQFFRYAQPQLLPGSDLLIFHGLSQTQDPERSEIIAMDLDSGTQTTLLTNAMNPRYVAETGHLLFMRQGSLMAVSFEPDRLAIVGDPVLIEEDVMQAVGMPLIRFETGAAQLAVSSSGHLAYVPGGVYPQRTNRLTRVTPEGEAEPLDSFSLSNFAIFSPRLSPGGDQLIFFRARGRGADIYVHDLVRDVTQQLSSGSFSNPWPEWSPNGESIAFSSIREDGVRNIYRMATDGSDEQPERLAPSDQNQDMMSWSSQEVIAYLQGGDIWVLSADGEPAPFFTSEARELFATFSPNGQWLAYVVEDAGELHEVYVRPYPGPGPAVLISGSGSERPAWSRDGTKLYFLQNNTSLQRTVMMEVDIAEGNPSRAHPLIDPWPYLETAPTRNYDVFEDGAFITSTIYEQSNAEEEVRGEPYRVGELQVVLNFFEVLRQRVAD